MALAFASSPAVDAPLLVDDAPPRCNGKSFQLTATAPSDGELVLEGTLVDGLFSVRLLQSARPAFLLETRGFHWINEHPYDR